MTALDAATGEALAALLRQEVPRHVRARLGEPPPAREALHQAVDFIGGHGDHLLYGGKHRDEGLRVLVWAVATLVIHTRGGVTIFGAHFCGAREPGCIDPACPQGGADA